MTKAKPGGITSEPKSPGANPKEFNSECLTAHNNYRKIHGSPDLTIDKKVIFKKTIFKYSVLRLNFTLNFELKKKNNNFIYQTVN